MHVSENVSRFPEVYSLETPGHEHDIHFEPI